MAATDIVQLIGRTVSLKKRGRDFVGLCPFHSEKTPSFHVNPARQFYYCYGCKAAGDAINFVKQRDRVEFMDALKSLAQDAGISIPKFGGRREDVSETAVVLEANSSATMFFENLLQDPARGKAAREYLQSRGITPETARTFRIGLAVEGWDTLLRGPLGQKFKPEQLHLAGLVKQRDPEKGPGFYDTFRNRLMFPIRDPNGRVIAFGGRVMPGSQDPAKYLNSPETPLFSKSRCVYGLDLARQRIVETQTAVVVEGYTDVVMAHQFGATNAVSILGTAMTEQHVQLLRRFAQRIVLLFDPDTAGELAVDRAVSLFLTQPVEIAIATFGEDLDPDEYLLKYGLEAWEKLIASAPEALTYKWKQLVKQFSADDGNLTGQQNAIAAYLDLIGQAKLAGPVDPIRWGLVLSQVGKLTGIPTEQLQKRLSSVKPATKRPVEASVPQPNMPAPMPSREPRRRGGVLSARDRAECWILGVILLEPGRWQRVQQVIGPEDFTDDRRRRLAEVYWSYQRDEGEPVFRELLTLLGDDSNGSQVASVRSHDLRELAIEVTDEVEGFAERQTDFESTLATAIDYLQQNRESHEKQKLISTLNRSTEENLGDDQQVDMLRKLQEQAKQSSAKRSMM
ncbi:DNA primase [Humisphaera borealis]|uniref:DNA primase n=1 Tax=Humisphaera borealis TaxID=2807512 RepID=A0A7M2WYX3_9BACT|nr:DNA primase [Humisphaera borealis]QOV90676.1 DNA primase [Humisphaera borealis]